MNATKLAILLAHALVGWALCAATMGIGMAVTSLDNTLVMHAVAAPVFFIGLSLLYFRRFGYTSPLQTAVVFIGVVVVLDVFVVALLINRSFEMFTSLLGTWIPFISIFLVTLVTGLIVVRNSDRMTP